MLVVVGIEFKVDGVEGAEKQLAKISENGRAAGGDAVLHEKQSELREERMNLNGGLEPRETDEGGREVFIGRLEWAPHVAEAKAGGAIEDRMPTAATRDGEVAAAVIFFVGEGGLAGVCLGWRLGLAGRGLGQRSFLGSRRIRRWSDGGR